MKRKQDFQTINRLMKSKDNASSGLLVCIASIEHGAVLRINKKIAHSYVYPNNRKSKEWFYCEKSIWRRYKKGERVSFKIYKDYNVVGLKNVFLNI